MNERNKCPKCGKGMLLANSEKPYRYTASGLDNVVLTGLNVYECADCGNGMVAIPQIGLLHRLIAFRVLTKPVLLNGKELRFLRKHFRLKAGGLAAKLNVSKTTISRWENEEPIGPANDRLVRIFFILNYVSELRSTHLYAEAGKRMQRELNEKSLNEIHNVFERSLVKSRKFRIEIDRDDVRQRSDPFQLEPA